MTTNSPAETVSASPPIGNATIGKIATTVPTKPIVQKGAMTTRSSTAMEGALLLCGSAMAGATIFSTAKKPTTTEETAKHRSQNVVVPMKTVSAAAPQMKLAPIAFVP